VRVAQVPLRFQLSLQGLDLRVPCLHEPMQPLYRSQSDAR
jgi:hypothetical protein